MTEPVSTPHDSPSPAPPPDRRRAMQWLAVLLGGLATLALGIPVVGYLFGSLIRMKRDEWIDLGPVSEFPLNETREVSFRNPDRDRLDGVAGGTTAYVRYLGRDDQQRDETKREQFQVFAVFCAHLGCPVSWFPQSGLFMCPCHGGVYYANGERASGPPPGPLYRYDYQVVKGRLQIRAGHLPTMYDTMQRSV